MVAGTHSGLVVLTGAAVKGIWCNRLSVSVALSSYLTARYLQNCELAKMLPFLFSRAAFFTSHLVLSSH